MTATLEDAIAIALEVHRGQVDKAAEVYIQHPLRLMLGMTTEAERMVAVLHDVVEDSEDTSLESLRKRGFPEEVVAAVDCVTRREGESDQERETYEQFIERIKPNPLARRVKIADLRDNLRLDRIPNPQPKDVKRLERYRKALDRPLKAQAERCRSEFGRGPEG